MAARRSEGCVPAVFRSERSVKSAKRHGQAPCSDSPRSCGTARGLLSMAPCGFDASFVEGCVRDWGASLPYRGTLQDG